MFGNNTGFKNIDNLKKDEEYQEALIDKEQAIEKASSETLLLIVDTHRKSYVEVPELLEATEKIVVIDHHRKSTEFNIWKKTFLEIYKFKK